MPSPVGQKGYTGNPNGRPKKGTALTDILRSMLDKPASDSPDAPKLKEVVMQKLVNLALDGDMVALKYLTDRIDGTPVQMVDQTLEGEIGVHSIGKPDFLKPKDDNN